MHIARGTEDGIGIVTLDSFATAACRRPDPHPGARVGRAWRIRMRVLTLFLLLFLTTTLTGCELIGDIFQAGIWVGVIAVLAVLALVAFLFSRMRR
jgi:hypothetical protein